MFVYDVYRMKRTNSYEHNSG